MKGSFSSSLWLCWGAATVVLPTSTSSSFAAAAAASFYSSPMSTFVTQRSGNGLITVSPKDEADQSALVVISHGLGDTAEGFADVAEVRVVSLPLIRRASGQAPLWDGILLLLFCFAQSCIPWKRKNIF